MPNKMKFIHFVVGLLLLGLAIASNYRPWTTQFQTGTVVASPSNNSTTSQDFTVSFGTPKTDASYSRSLAISSLYDKFCQYGGPDDGRYSVIVSQSGRSSSSLTINARTYLASNYITRLEVRWMVMKSSFTYIYIAHETLNYYGFAYRYDNSINIWISVMGIPFTVGSTTTKVMTMINGLDFYNDPSWTGGSGSGSADHFSINVLANFNSGVLMYGFETVVSSRSCYLYYLAVDFIVYDWSTMKSAQRNQQFLCDWFAVSDYSDPSVSHSITGPNPLKSTVLFYGTSQFRKSSSGSRTSFDISIQISGNSLEGRVNNYQSIYVHLIYFATTVNCPANTYFNSTDYTCYLCTNISIACNSCSATSCNGCDSPYQLNGTSGCFLCQTLNINCLNCTASQCLACQNPYEVNGTSCMLCSDLDPHCTSCTNTTCLDCQDPYEINGTDCFICSQSFDNCANCTNLGCTICMEPQYWLNGSTCDVNCSNIDPMCSSCTDSGGSFACLNCTIGYKVQNAAICVSVCGDGLIINGSEQCDDGNLINGDGCSSECTVQDHFFCQNSSNSSSTCQLTSLSMTVICIFKSEQANEFTVTLELFPFNLFFYQLVKWQTAFENSSTELKCVGANYDSSDHRLRVAFAYFQDLQGVPLSINISAYLSSHYFSNITSELLALPSRTQNNRQLQFYSENTYSMGKAVQWLSMGVAAVSLLLFAAGYFGAKLPALEGIAVVQLAALLLFTVDNTAPTYDGLKYLGWALGATTIFRKQYFYEDTQLPYTVRSQFDGTDSISTFNVFLGAVFVPLLMALVIKVLSVTVYKGRRRVEKAWKYSLGTFTFYGLMFLAYGQLCSLALGVRHLNFSSFSSIIGLIVGAVFSILLLVYVLVSFQLPMWFGSFKSRFYKYGIANYFLLFSVIQKAVTSLVVGCFSPGILPESILSILFLIELLFIAIKKPYVLGQWKRPCVNKVLTIIICFLYLAANLTDSRSLINQFIPLAVLLILVAVLVYSSVIAVIELREYWKSYEENAKLEQKFGPPLSVEESHNRMMKDFQAKMMPDASQQSSVIRQILQHQFVDIGRWKWQQYPIIYSLDLPSATERKKRKLLAHQIVEQKQNECSEQRVFTKEGEGEI